MDIGSKSGYPSSALSNFAPHAFVFDGVECASLEGLLDDIAPYVMKLCNAKCSGYNKEIGKTVATALIRVSTCAAVTAKPPLPQMPIAPILSLSTKGRVPM